MSTTDKFSRSPLITGTETFEFGPDQQELGERALSERYDIRTICNVIRRIHLIARNEEVSHLCAEAIYMAKRMSHKLTEYNRDWGRGLWLKEKTPLPSDE